MHGCLGECEYDIISEWENVELMLEVGKVYKTRDGSKACINFSTIHKSVFTGVIIGKYGVFMYHKNGEIVGGSLDIFDILEEWND